jgi:hypothetical protein
MRRSFPWQIVLVVLRMMRPRYTSVVVVVVVVFVG